MRKGPPPVKQMEALRIVAKRGPITTSELRRAMRAPTIQHVQNYLKELERKRWVERLPETRVEITESTPFGRIRSECVIYQITEAGRERA